MTYTALSRLDYDLIINTPEGDIDIPSLEGLSNSATPFSHSFNTPASAYKSAGANTGVHVDSADNSGICTLNIVNGTFLSAQMDYLSYIVKQRLVIGGQIQITYNNTIQNERWTFTSCSLADRGTKEAPTSTDVADRVFTFNFADYLMQNRARLV